MRFNIRFKDENGWPMMSVDGLVQENRDTLKIQNYALNRFKDFSALCLYHRKETIEAKKAIKEKKTTRAHSIASIFRDLFMKQENEKIAALEKENRQLRAKIYELTKMDVTLPPPDTGS